MTDRCEAWERKPGQGWEPCPQLATTVLVVHGQPKGYCQHHRDQFVNLLPKGSWVEEQL